MTIGTGQVTWPEGTKVIRIVIDKTRDAEMVRTVVVDALFENQQHDGVIVEAVSDAS